MIQPIMRCLVYRQASGTLWLNGSIVEQSAYSGKGLGLNNPKLERIKNVGPLPAGLYRLAGPISEPTARTFRLIYEGGPGLFGRDGFLVHGGNAGRDSSRGCIVASRKVRQLLRAGDLLTVIP